MTTLNLYEAKTQLSKLVDRAAAGEEIVIAKAGKPMVKLVPVTRKKTVRRPGSLKGKVWIADDFDELPREIEDLFYEGDNADFGPPTSEERDRK